MIKNSKNIRFKKLYLSLIICLSATFLGCSQVNQASSNSNQATNTSTVSKTTETPKITPQVKSSEEPESNDQTRFTNSNKPSENQSKGNLERKINQTNFDKITNGMSYDEVTKIFSDKGFHSSSMKIHGKETEIFLWSNDDFSKYISLEFENNKVIEKKKKGF